MNIISFSDSYRWLSNFAPAEIEFDGHKFPSVEHAYVYAKMDDPLEKRDYVLYIKQGEISAGIAKRIGKHVRLRKDWNDVRLPIMLELTRKKYSHLFYKEKLLETGDAHIEEGNNWGDAFWGTVNGEGENHLGKIIMQVREEIRNGS